MFEFVLGYSWKVPGICLIIEFLEFVYSIFCIEYTRGEVGSSSEKAVMI